MDRENTSNKAVPSGITDKIASFLNSVSDLESDLVVPEWAKLLLESLKGLIVEFQDTNEGQRERIAEQGADLTKLTESFDVRGVVVDALVRDRDRLIKEVNYLSVTLDEIENYSRRSCLLFHGTREEIQE